jgi:hypothetical protein
MRVADAVRETSVVHRLKVGEKFTDSDGDWEVVRKPELLHGGTHVKVYIRPYPAKEGQRARAYVWHRGSQVKMLRK